MIDLRFGRWEEALADVGEVDAVVCDPPYSERTHAGHDTAASATRRPEPRYFSADRPDWRDCPNRRKAIAFDSLGAAAAQAFVESWAPRTRGWICILTDHLLVPVFTEALEAAGRYVFSPLACVDSGSRVRLGGDGPAQWSVWLVVSRPRTQGWARWGSLPGAYVRRGKKERSKIVGGKPEWLMRAIIADYSRPGDLICDPFAGAGTTLVAAHQLDRRAVGAEMDPATWALARHRIDRETAQLALALEVTR